MTDINKDALIEEFFANPLPSQVNKERFYDLFLDFLDSKHIYYTEEQEDELESLAFKKAKEIGIIGYETLVSIEDINVFTEKFKKYTKEKRYNLFHITYELEDELELSVSDIWRRWNSFPPRGWLAGWCNCGHFFPYTFDIGRMDLEKDTLMDGSKFYTPRTINVDELSKIDFCSDGCFRLHTNNGELFTVVPYTMDTGLVYKFVDNPLDILR